MYYSHLCLICPHLHEPPFCDLLITPLAFGVKNIFSVRMLYFHFPPLCPKKCQKCSELHKVKHTYLYLSLFETPEKSNNIIGFSLAFETWKDSEALIKSYDLISENVSWVQKCRLALPAGKVVFVEYLWH